MDGFQLACAAADIWTHSVNARICQSKEQINGDLQERFRRIPNLRQYRPKVATSWDELQHNSQSISSKYTGVHPKTLFEVWLLQAEFYFEYRRTRERALSLKEATQSDPNECSPLEHRAGLAVMCGQYAKILRVRTGTRARRLVPSIFDRSELSTEVDTQIADLLEKVEKYLKVELKSQDFRQESDDSGQRNWLFEWSPGVLTSVCWPAPLLVDFLDSARSKARADADQGRRIDFGRDQGILSIFQQIMDWYFEFYEAPQEAFQKLWTGLLQSYFTEPEGRQGAELAKLATMMVSDAQKNQESQSWRTFCLAETVNLLASDVVLLPPLINGTFHWDNLEDKELQIDVSTLRGTSSSSHSRIHTTFGVRGHSPALVKIAVAESEQCLWRQWESAHALKDPGLDSHYRQARSRLCSGKRIHSVRDSIKAIASNQKGWFHQLVEPIRREQHKLHGLRAVLNEAHVEIYPRLDEAGNPQWSEDLKASANATRVPGTLRKLTNEPQIQAVRLFAISPEQCEFDYTEPIVEPFCHLVDQIGKHRDEINLELLEKMDDFYQLHYRRENGSEQQIGEAFLSVVRLLVGQFENHVLSQQMAASLLREVQEVGLALSPPLRLLPAKYRLAEAWSPEEDQAVERSFQYNDEIPRGRASQVQDFGLRIGDAIQTPASIVVSAGESPPKFQEMLELLPGLEGCLGSDIVRMLRDLPRLETLESSRESLYTELFKMLWPWPCDAKQVVLKFNDDPQVRELRQWYCHAVEARQLLVVRTPRDGDAVLVTEEWRLGIDYDEANPDHGLTRGDVVDVVVRPLLMIYKDHDARKVVKEKAVIYVTE